jgi:stearoyl-CoA desaturase (delta-9 desaturase)
MSAPLASVRFRRPAFAALVSLHLAAAAAIWIGPGPSFVPWLVVLYLIQMFGVTAGYHRYFAHRSFETSRPMRFVLAALALTSVQRPVLWWSAKHRDHHRFSDTEGDVHSPVVHGWVRSHLTWAFYTDCDEPVSHVNDLERYPEIRWLDRWWRVPSLVLLAAAWLVGGRSGAFAAVWSTVLVYHATGAINSLAHVIGSRRYPTRDQSRNHWALALLTLGEGWHNNHHHYQSSCRQGFYWWEVDLTWLALRALERLGLVWDLREPPATVRDGVRERSRGR